MFRISLLLFVVFSSEALSLPKCSRRKAILGWVGTMVAPQACNAAAGIETRVESLEIEDFLRKGVAANPMGVSGQAGKSRPRTGIALRDGSEVSRNPRTGDVLAEIVVDGSSGKSAVLSSFSSPWPLATGTVFDVECRDASTGDSAFLSVSGNVGGKPIDQISDSFILNTLLKPDGRFSFYGQPTDIKVLSSQVKDGYKLMDISFSTISQATQTEIPRRARLAATIPQGSVQAVILVGSSSALRWKKGSDKEIGSTINSFRAIPAPKSSMKIRGEVKT